MLMIVSQKAICTCAEEGDGNEHAGEYGLHFLEILFRLLIYYRSNYTYTYAEVTQHRAFHKSL